MWLQVECAIACSADSPWSARDHTRSTAAAPARARLPTIGSTPISRAMPCFGPAIKRATYESVRRGSRTPAGGTKRILRRQGKQVACIGESTQSGVAELGTRELPSRARTRGMSRSVRPSGSVRSVCADIVVPTVDRRRTIWCVIMWCPSQGEVATPSRTSSPRAARATPPSTTTSSASGEGGKKNPPTAQRPRYTISPPRAASRSTEDARGSWHSEQRSHRRAPNFSRDTSPRNWETAGRIALALNVRLCRVAH